MSETQTDRGSLPVAKTEATPAVVAGAELTLTSSPTRPRWPWIVGLAVVVAGAVVTWLVVGRNPEDATDQSLVELSTATVQLRDLSETTQLDGELGFESSATISAPSSGIVTVIPGTGDVVERGDVLFAVDAEVSEADRLAAEQRLTSARAQASNAVSQYSNVTQGASSADLASAEAAVLDAEQRLADLVEPAGEAELVAARAQLERAQDAHDEMSRGPTSAEVAAADSAVVRAQQTLAAAQVDRDLAHVSMVEAQTAYCALNPIPVDGLCSSSDIPLSTDDLADLTDEIADRTASGDAGAAEVMERFVKASVAYDAASAAYVGASANLQSARDAFQRLTPTQAQIDQAYADLLAAQDRLAELESGPTESALRQAEANVSSTRERLAELRAGASSSERSQASANLENARLGLQIAELQYGELLAGADISVLMYGDIAAYRSMSLESGPGTDIEQLEANLAALGFDADGTMAVDGVFDEATVTVVDAWLTSLGLEATGRVDLGLVVFLPGPSQVGSSAAVVGDSVGPGTPLLELTPIRHVIMSVVGGSVSEGSTTTQRVDVQLAVDDRDLLEVGGTVGIELPDGTDVDGTVAAIDSVPTIVPAQGNTPGQSYVGVTIALAEPVDEVWTGATVDVTVVTDLVEDAHTVPVSSLLALAEGGYAVEVVQSDSTTRLVAVRTGMFADGFVQVEGEGLESGVEVVVPG